MLTIGEEQGLYWALHLAEFAKTNNWNIIAMLNNDMIGNSNSSGTGIHDNTQVRVFSEAIPFLETEDEAKRWVDAVVARRIPTERRPPELLTRDVVARAIRKEKRQWTMQVKNLRSLFVARAGDQRSLLVGHTRDFHYRNFSHHHLGGHVQGDQKWKTCIYIN